MIQSQALSILKTGTNVFLTGEPGSGKTHTVNAYATYLRKRSIEPAITASTGIAATHIGGMTIHSWSGIGIKNKLDKNDLHKIASNALLSKRVMRAKVLVIDEVSMLPPETLSMVDAICREVKQSPEPFGGIQVVLVGDFFQLPPVVRKETLDEARGTHPKDGSALIERPIARFAYDSPAWKMANPAVCYLTEQYRQDDNDFLHILTAIRRNAFDANHLRRIETRKTVQTHASLGSNTPKLFSRNADVDRMNDEILAKLPGKQRAFAMSSKGPGALVAALKKGCLSPETLCLKAGATVIFTKNNQKDGFVNGTLGAVEGFEEKSGYPMVKMRSGRRITVEPMDWALEENGATRPMGRVPGARITQIPLRLAWALTVHKSQGMSLDEAVMDLSDVFEFGQGYVALSRVRRLSGLHLLGWNKRAFQVHPEVLTRDAEFRAQSELATDTLSKTPENELAATHERFVKTCGGSAASKASGKRTGAREKARGDRRWESTLALILSGKTIRDVATERGRTEGTIMEHLESLRLLGKLPAKDISHLALGREQAISEIHGAFRNLNTDKLSPVFEKLGNAYSYDELRMARLLLDEQFAREIPAQPNFDKIKEKHPKAYLPWDKEQDERLRELFTKGSPVADLARMFDRTKGAIRSRLAKLGL